MVSNAAEMSRLTSVVAFLVTVGNRVDTIHNMQEYRLSRMAATICRLQTSDVW